MVMKRCLPMPENVMKFNNGWGKRRFDWNV
jgi:hypothetical protein